MPNMPPNLQSTVGQSANGTRISCRCWSPIASSQPSGCLRAFDPPVNRQSLSIFVNFCRLSIVNSQRSILACRDEKMGTNEKNEKVFFLACFQWLILWKTGGWVKRGQSVCKSYTLSMGLLLRDLLIEDCRWLCALRRVVARLVADLSEQQAGLQLGAAPHPLTPWSVVRCDDVWYK